MSHTHWIELCEKFYQAALERKKDLTLSVAMVDQLGRCAMLGKKLGNMLFELWQQASVGAEENIVTSDKVRFALMDGIGRVVYFSLDEALKTFLKAIEGWSPQEGENERKVDLESAKEFFNSRLEVSVFDIMIAMNDAHTYLMPNVNVERRNILYFFKEKQWGRNDLVYFNFSSLCVHNTNAANFERSAYMKNKKKELSVTPQCKALREALKKQLCSGADVPFIMVSSSCAHGHKALRTLLSSASELAESGLSASSVAFSSRKNFDSFLVTPLATALDAEVLSSNSDPASPLPANPTPCLSSADADAPPVSCPVETQAESVSVSLSTEPNELRPPTIAQVALPSSRVDSPLRTDDVPFRAGANVKTPGPSPFLTAKTSASRSNSRGAAYADVTSSRTSVARSSTTSENKYQGSDKCYDSS